jgi:CRP-like cAMP-binding protein
MMESILRFCAGLPQRELAAGEILLAYGGVDRKLYVLIEGEVAISNEEIQIDVVSEPGAIFGEMAVLLGVPHTATVTASAPSRVCEVDEGAAFLRSDPEVSLLVARLLARRLQSATAYLVDIKRQYEDQAGHLGMVDEVLASLLHQQDRECTPGSERDPDTAI